jgi:hypothetical protein
VGPFAGQDITETFVFVYPVGRKRDISNLAIHYESASTDGPEPKPHAAWLGDSLLSVTVPHQAEVVLSNALVGPVAVRYESR